MNLRSHLKSIIWLYLGALGVLLLDDIMRTLLNIIGYSFTTPTLLDGAFDLVVALIAALIGTAMGKV